MQGPRVGAAPLPCKPSRALSSAGCLSFLIDPPKLCSSGAKSTGGGAELARCTFAVILSAEHMRLHHLTLVLFRSYITNRSNLLNDARI